ncbi:hypothetical protein MYAM1_000769 [Malassezia yamatoensis]|uniref:Citrate transporter-like domain-containing protein n=1 Tax=Malassezia yamatoensis TaxID=253288 RepID=A0AAJ5YUU9_9BASI|nr:hypothetical protein MYAM1_000769 [Malassezia yamatoensis]
MAQQPAAALDSRGIVVVVVFSVVSLLCIVPVYIPLPLRISKPLRRYAQLIRDKLDIPTEQDHKQSPMDLTEKQEPVENQQGLNETDDPRQKSNDARVYIPLTHITAPVLGVLLLLAATCIGGAEVRAGIAGESGVLPYDVLALFLSLGYIAISLDTSGLLRYLACHVCRLAAFDGRVLYVVLYLFLWLAGVLLGNDPVILSGTAFLVYVTRVAGISPPSAWIWGQFVAANIASAVLVSSNPTNLVIASGFDVSFVQYTAYMVLPSFVSAITALLILMVLFRTSRLPSKATNRTWEGWSVRINGAAHDDSEFVEYIPKQIQSPDIQPRLLLTDPFGAVFSSVVLLAVLGTLIGTSVIGGIEVYQVGIPGAVLCLIRDVVADLRAYKKSTTSFSRKQGIVRRIVRVLPQTTSTLRRLPVNLVPFAFGMFILVQGLSHVGFVTIMAKGIVKVCKSGVGATAFFMAFLSIVLCNFGGTNIGATILLTKVMQDAAFLDAIEPAERQLTTKAGMYAVAFGSNLGALGGTFAASLAGLLWRDSLAHYRIHVRTGQFLWWCIITLIPSAVAGLGVLLAEVVYFHIEA